MPYDFLSDPSFRLPDSCSTAPHPTRRAIQWGHSQAAEAAAGQSEAAAAGEQQFEKAGREDEQLVTRSDS